MNKIRYPEEWTEKELDRLDDAVSCSGNFGVARLVLEIATSLPPRREIKPGTIVHVSNKRNKWAHNGIRIEFYNGRDKDDRHIACGVTWEYVRPVKPGWKPGDPLDPPNEGDL